MIFKSIAIPAALKIVILTCLQALATLPLAAEGKQRVVTTLPDLAWVAAEIGGPRVEAGALLRGSENPHYLDAVPDFIRRVADADVVCLIGLELEAGYMPAVLARSGNAAVQPGGVGYCEVASKVTVQDKPTGPVDRSMGDVHPGGNPHFHLSPVALSEAAVVIYETLARVDPQGQATYQDGLTKLQAKLRVIQTATEQKLKPLLALGPNPLVIEYHKEFTYFFSAYGIPSFGSIEEKPGVAPSAARLALLAKAAKEAGVRVIVAASYNPSRTLERFSELSGIPLAVVPPMMYPSQGITTYDELQSAVADALILKAVGAGTVGSKTE